VLGAGDAGVERRGGLLIAQEGVGTLGELLDGLGAGAEVVGLAGDGAFEVGGEAAELLDGLEGIGDGGVGGGLALLDGGGGPAVQRLGVALGGVECDGGGGNS